MVALGPSGTLLYKNLSHVFMDIFYITYKYIIYWSKFSPFERLTYSSSLMHEIQLI